MAKLNVLNQVFGRYTVVGSAPSRGTHTYWECRCECGSLREVEIANLRSGRAKSCGCLRDELAQQAAPAKFTKHGDHKTRLYRIYKHMHQRCELLSHTEYPNYGAKGIQVSSEWDTYEKFREWALNNGYSEELTLDRKESVLGYNAQNCRWATYETQARNRRKTSSQTSSRFIGVSWCTSRKAWRASVQVSKQPVAIGNFTDEVSAAKARDQYIIDQGLQHFKLNF